MQQANQTAGMADRLPEPDDGLLGASAGVVLSGPVFGLADFVPGGRHGDCDEQGVGGAGDEAEEGGLVERVDVVEGEGGWEA